MAAKTYRGRLVEVHGQDLVLETPEGIEVAFPTRGLNIDDDWVGTYLGTEIECEVLDGFIEVVRPHE